MTFSKNKSTNTAHDLVQKENPNFHILIYPEPLTVPKKVSKSAPPLFSLASNNDQCCPASIFKLLKAYREVGADVEAHFYSKGDHGFNMGDRSAFQTISKWPQRLADWLVDYQYFE